MAMTVTGDLITAANNSDATIYVNGVEAIENESVESGDVFKIEANEGFKFSSSPIIYGSYNPVLGMVETWTLPLSESDTVAEEIYSGQVSFSPTSWVIETEESEDTSFLLTDDFISQANNNNATIYVNSVETTLETTISEGDNVTFIANEGFLFTEEGVYFTGYIPGTGGNPVFELVVDQERETAVGIYDGSLGGSAMTQLFVTTEPTENYSSINNVYLVSEDDIEEVNIHRFIPGTNGTNDYGVYILSILRLPFEVDDSLIAGDNTVKLGDVTLNLTVPQLVTDKIVVDMGVISVPEVHGNSLDYTNVIATLHLPFAGSIMVDSRQVIGEEISIEYIVDAYTGSATVNLKSTKVDGEVFYSTNIDLGVSVPYSTVNSGPELHNNIGRPIGDNRIRSPYLEVVRNNAVLPDGFFTIPVVDEGSIENETGFIRAENVDLKVSAITGEKETILRLLMSGVVIQ